MSGRHPTPKDVFKAFQEAKRLEAEGKLDEALRKRGEGSLAAFGAIPFIGAIAKAPKAAAKFKRLFRASRAGKLEPGNPRSFSIPRKTERKIVCRFDQPACGTSSRAMTPTILTGARPDIKDIPSAACTVGGDMGRL